MNRGYRRIFADIIKRDPRKSASIRANPRPNFLFLKQLLNKFPLW